MYTPTDPVKIDTLYGPLYIAVIGAVRNSFHDIERGSVTELRPYLRIATDPTFEADPNADDHWTIRGRAYAVHYQVFYQDLTDVEYASGSQGERWHRGAYIPYQGGFRNDARRPVTFQAKTWDLMWEETVRALDTFAAQRPSWQDLSRYLLLRGEQEAAMARATDLRREAAEYETKALALGAQAMNISIHMGEDAFQILKES